MPKGLNVPQLGGAVPKRGSLVSRFVGRTILRLGDWRFEGEPPDLPRFVMIGAPHTSNWDAAYGLGAMLATGLHCHWMAKDAVFKAPFRNLLIWLGGLPVDRSMKHGVVDLIASEFRRRDKFILAITPEGTRKRVEYWKTGFYYIALQAEVPIVVAFMDYRRRTLGFGPIIEPTGNIDEDLRPIEKFYRNMKGKRPEHFNPCLRVKVKAGGVG